MWCLTLWVTLNTLTEFSLPTSAFCALGGHECCEVCCSVGVKRQLWSATNGEINHYGGACHRRPNLKRQCEKRKMILPAAGAGRGKTRASGARNCTFGLGAEQRQSSREARVHEPCCNTFLLETGPDNCVQKAVMHDCVAPLLRSKLVVSARSRLLVADIQGKKPALQFFSR